MIQNRRAIIGSVLYSAGACLLVVALGSYPDASVLAQVARQNQSAGGSGIFQAEAGKHIARGERTVLGMTATQNDLQRSGTDVVGNGVVLPTTAMPTRSSFVAHWKSVSEATDYRLDVSTNSSFSSYVSGYEDLDAGNVPTRTAG